MDPEHITVQQTAATSSAAPATELSQEEANRKTMLDGIAAMEKMANIALSKLASGDTSVKVISKETNGQVMDKTVAELDEEERSRIMRKVQAFLDPTHASPLFIGLVRTRNKLFVGCYPKQQDILDVKRQVGAMAGAEMNAYQATLAIVAELQKCVIGWVPIRSNRAAWIQAHGSFENFDKWPALEPVEWMNTRDTYVLDDEVFPLWEQYVEWRNLNTPTREELSFYYSLMP